MVAPLTFNQLRQYTARKAKLVTAEPVKVKLVDKFSMGKQRSDTVARSYVLTHYPKDKTQPTRVVGHEIEIKRNYYKECRNDPRELKSCVSHELAHVVVKTHGKKFAKVARKLGADENHTRAVWKRT